MSIGVVLNICIPGGGSADAPRSQHCGPNPLIARAFQPMAVHHCAIISPEHPNGNPKTLKSLSVPTLSGGVVSGKIAVHASAKCSPRNLRPREFLPLINPMQLAVFWLRLVIFGRSPSHQMTL